MQRKPALVSVIIPTLNEGKALPICLRSVIAQGYGEIETVVVDSGSRDGTREAALEAGATIVDYPGRPLGARYEGLLRSKGEVVLLLDADQVLFDDTVQRAVSAIEGLDMLVLEESSYRPQGFLQRSIARQKEALQRHGDQGELPPHCYPRIYRREILEATFSRLPKEMLGEIFAFDDRVLFAKAQGISKRVGFLPKGVMHIEESSWKDMMRHAYRQGKSAKGLEALGLGEDAIAPESSLILLKRAARNRYLAYSVLKELSFRTGKALG
ncbi:MAG: glycosyltransferase family 2 protein [Methanomassiliicoccales archaeon]|nr:glycosyltransferase family 2 protein [Methanomassiliicoccales archaeon]MDD1756986.1 glycosyltransferase family 2 protein [Methanomassiliicoccales archaeon]